MLHGPARARRGSFPHTGRLTRGEGLVDLAPRLRRRATLIVRQVPRGLRHALELTLADVAAATKISVSTLSRLESGQRRPNLELLLPLARMYGVPLDDLVSTPHGGDPRVHARPFTRHGRTFLPLTRRTDALQAYKVLIHAGRAREHADLKTHEGYEWLYVLSGKLRLVLGEDELLMRAGEAAEFDTWLPHAIETGRQRARGIADPVWPAG